MECPKFPTRSCVEGPEASVVSGSDQCQAAGGHDGTSQAGAAGALLPFGKVVGYTQDRSPGNLAAIHVNRYELSPRRFSTWKVLLGIPEPNGSGERTCVRVTPGFVGHDAHGLTQIVHIHHEEAERRIERSARVVHAAVRAWKIN